jgi:tetrahydromethanopterin S-methyltransferase subunit G
MATTLALAMQISANTASLAKSVKDVERRLDTLGNSGKKAGRDLGVLKNIAIGRVAISSITAVASGLQQATQALVGFGRSVANSIDASSKLSRSLGITFEELSGLELAGDLAGVSSDQLGAALSKLQVQLRGAQTGSKEAVDAFTGLGLSVQGLAGQNATQQFQAIASAINEIPDPAGRSAAAVALFGKSGASLLPLFEGGGDAVAGIANQAIRLGLALNDVQARNVEAMNDAFTLAGKSVEGVVRQIVADLSPGIQAAADAFTSFVGDAGGASIGQGFVDGLLNVADVFAQVFDRTVSGLNVFATSFGLYSESVERSSSNLAGVVDALTAVGLVVQRVFNGFLNIGNVLARIVGNAVSALGKAISFIPGTGEAGQTLQQFGADLATAAAEQVEARNKAFEDAYNRFLSGENPNQGAATQAVEQIRAAVENARNPIAQIQSQVDAAREKIIQLEESTGLPAERLREAFEAYRQAAEIAAADGQLVEAEALAVADAQSRLNALISEETGARNAAAAALAAQLSAQEKAAKKNEEVIAKVNADLDKAFSFEAFTVAPGAFRQFSETIKELRSELEAEVIDPDTYVTAVSRLQEVFEQAVVQSEQLVGIQEQLNNAGAAFEISQEGFDAFSSRIEELRQNLTDNIIDEDEFKRTIDRLKEGLDLQVKLDTRVAEITEERLDKLSRVSQEPLQVQDLRSGGIDEFLRIASGRQDPAIEEARRQTQELQKLRQEIVRVGGAVEIIGG